MSLIKYSAGGGVSIVGSAKAASGPPGPAGPPGPPGPGGTFTAQYTDIWEGAVPTTAEEAINRLSAILYSRTVLSGKLSEVPTGFKVLTLPNAGSGTDVFIVKYNTSGVTQWATRISGTAADVGNAITVDTSGNTYVTGSYTGTVTIFNADTSTFGTLTNAGQTDVFIVKYNTSGVAQWSTRISGTSSDVGNAITVDTSGNTYITGSYTGTVTIFNTDTTTFGTLTNAGGTDVFIAKYNTSGVVQWATRISGTAADVGNAIRVDATGNTYVTGEYTGTVTIFNADTSTFGTLTNEGSTDVFIVKYNTSGVAQWTTRIGGTSTDTGYGITVDASGNTYVTGFYIGTVTIFNTDTTTFGTLTNAGAIDAFIVKYNTSGVAQWSTRIGSGGNDFGFAISVDTLGNTYVTGSYTGTVTIFNADTTTFGTLTSTGGNEVFVVKYNTSGVAQWGARISGVDSDNGRGINVDSSGNVYVTGSYSNIVTIFNGNSTTFGVLTSAGSSDVFVVKYNTSGVVQWVSTMVGTASESGNAIAVDASGNPYVTGSYAGAPLYIKSAEI